MSLILITGGVRSGKSRFAEQWAHELGGSILYVATGKVYDQEMEQRIQLHQERRPADWGLAECPHHLDLVFQSTEGYEGILIDCLSTWISNRLMEVPEERMRDEQVHLTLREDLQRWVAAAKDLEIPVIVVTSEVGLGGVAMSRLGRWFQDILGECNQWVAKEADEVYAVLSGIPWRIKG
ncbi:bifunctional adenosylcobinamide kinase/adenosylcobinamide-phosphate guanylyltransferase [Ammoniphilus sp. YIM 78166]|uniref:bifunctional adenosylcobinamide kinase/adenosylcobinamide-phosphate guanylyltransferase n=1 Tax=Ammoniphilus sp. YIM 78166 TaxID=1644106 RepID=UPI00106F1406|nr:bifunctional adenosylcobinamide kinase/adenosylcobinamide-phosphate guanylyltransferase [Ammoniphilus sp. YIM 78166]